ncbi:MULTISPECIES: hypothetical protein [Streptomyces]|uniref:Uncharacterized protein n=1 Tax=Streptomyces rhizosphaericus TaxID=114699 RepID=A0A6G4AIH6_9ACTN|nr:MULTISPECIES: hypothetical protein [Streptomyces]MBA6438652.1 hypothetical protein [Streptomyces sp. GMR22]NEW73135.1 hypothetical protein [Streptomyces rhizosphaericus]
MVKETEDPTGTEIAHETTHGHAHGHAHERPASAGARRISVTGARMLREALRHGGDALSAALREADDGLLLSALDEGLPAERATRVVVELVRRAPERGPELADAVCEKVLLAQLYLDPPHRAPGGAGGPAPDPDRRLRVRNALMLYEGLVRPYARRGAVPELMACVLPGLWTAGDGMGREVVRRIVGTRQSTGFGEKGWKALFGGVAEECGEHQEAAARAARRAARRRWRRGGAEDGSRIDLKPGQLWVSALLGFIAVALVLIVVIAAG